MMGPGLLAHKGKPGDGLIESMRKYMTAVMRRPENRHSPLLVSGEWNYIRTQASPAGYADDGATQVGVVAGRRSVRRALRSCWAARITTCPAPASDTSNAILLSSTPTTTLCQ